MLKFSRFAGLTSYRSPVEEHRVRSASITIAQSSADMAAEGIQCHMIASCLKHNSYAQCIKAVPYALTAPSTS